MSTSDLRRYHSGTVYALAPSEVFVFGSNDAGIHGAGAAAVAQRLFEAVYGVGEGPTGRCYAIPTKDRELRTKPLGKIRNSVERFFLYARSHPGTTFLLTRVGCGLAGYRDADIKPLFAEAPLNVVLPPEWK